MFTLKNIFLLVFALGIVGVNIGINAWKNSVESFLNPIVESYLESVVEFKALEHRQSYNIAFDQKGMIWVTGDPILVLDKNGELVKTYTQDDIGLDISSFRSLLYIRNGVVIVDLDSRISIFNGTEWQIFVMPKDTCFCVVNADPNGNIWLYDFHDRDGLWYFDGKQWINYTSANSDLIDDNVSSIGIDNQGRAWVGTNMGLTIADGQNWTNYNTNNSSILANNIDEIYFDNQNRIWLSHENGISIFDGKDWEIFTEEISGFPEQIQEIVFDSAGRAWILSRYDLIDGGLTVFDGKVWKYFYVPDLADSQNLNLNTDDNGNVWIQAYPSIIAVPSDFPLLSHKEITALNTYYWFLSQQVTLSILLIDIWLLVAIQALRKIGIGVVISMLIAKLALGLSIIMAIPVIISGLIGRHLEKSGKTNAELYGVAIGLIIAIILFLCAISGVTEII